VTWFKVDDGLFANPKWVACSVAARALWVTAGSWAGKQEDSGRVPRHIVAFLGGRPRDAAELVANGLWELDEEGWRFHDWFEYQPTPEQIEAKRAAAAERQRKWRERQRESQRYEPVSDGVGHAPPDPTRPDPVPDPENPSSSSSHNDSSRGGSRTDDDDLEEANRRTDEIIDAGGYVENRPAYVAAIVRELREERANVWMPPEECGCESGWIPDGHGMMDACPACLPGAAAMQRGSN
jgi:hypothetical protein